MSALPGYNRSWIKTACETIVLFIDVGFCEGLAVFGCLEAASL